MLDILDRFSGRRVLVYGDLMLDVYIHGVIERLSPEEPAAPVVEVTMEQTLPGGAANLAANLRELGADPVVVGLCGEDEDGTRLRKTLEALGCECWLCPEEGRPTTRKERILHQERVLIRVDRESRRPPSSSSARALARHALREAKSADCVIICDYLKGAVTEAAVARLKEQAGASGQPLVADAKPEHMNWMTGVTLLTPNHKEAIRMVGDSADPQTLAVRMVERMGVEAAMVTLGAEGIAVASASGERMVLPAVRFPYPPINISGCGDTVTATAALSRLAGADWCQAAFLANAAAGLVAHKREATVTRRELLQTVEELLHED